MVVGAEQTRAQQTGQRHRRYRVQRGGGGVILSQSMYILSLPSMSGAAEACELRGCWGFRRGDLQELWGRGRGSVEMADAT